MDSAWTRKYTLDCRWTTGKQAALNLTEAIRCVVVKCIGTIPSETQLIVNVVIGYMRVAQTVMPHILFLGNYLFRMYEIHAQYNWMFPLHMLFFHIISIYVYSPTPARNKGMQYWKLGTCLFMDICTALLVHRKNVPKRRHNAQGRKLRSFITSFCYQQSIFVQNINIRIKT
jgi:hypothetical protein